MISAAIRSGNMSTDIKKKLMSHTTPVSFAVKCQIKVADKTSTYQTRTRVVHSKDRIPNLVAAFGEEMYNAQMEMLCSYAVADGNGSRIIDPLLLLKDATLVPLQDPSLEEKSSLNGWMKKTYIRPRQDSDYEGVLRQNSQVIVDKLKSYLSAQMGLKFSITLTLRMRRSVQLEEEATFFTQTKTAILYPSDNIEEAVNQHIIVLLDNIDNLEREGSGWIVNYIEKIEISKARYVNIKLVIF